jgi:putative ABC transport system permease protein
VATFAGVLAAMIAGLLPAWFGTRVDPSEAMRGSARGTSESPGSRLAMRGLLIGELALSCALFTGAAWLLRSFTHMATMDRGLTADGVVTAWVDLDRTTFPDSLARKSVALAVEQAARELPGVQQVAMSFGVPPDPSFSFGTWTTDVPHSGDLSPLLSFYGVRPDFFALYRIPLLRGRTFTASDTKHDVIVSADLARQFWPDVDPVGHWFESSDDHERFHVIGVAGELRFPTLESHGDFPEFYQPFDLSHSSIMVSLRCGHACPPTTTIQERLRRVGAGITVSQVGPLEAVYRTELARPRAIALLGTLFGTISLVVVAGGLFGVLGYSVSRRRREMGIRSALGATTARIHLLVIREGAALAAIGLGLGGAGAWLGARALSHLVYDTPRSDPTTWLAVAAVIGATTVAACWLPARRASAVDVAQLVREE